MSNFNQNIYNIPEITNKGWNRTQSEIYKDLSWYQDLSLYLAPNSILSRSNVTRAKKITSEYYENDKKIFEAEGNYWYKKEAEEWVFQEFENLLKELNDLENSVVTYNTQQEQENHLKILAWEIDKADYINKIRREIHSAKYEYLINNPYLNTQLDPNNPDRSPIDTPPICNSNANGKTASDILWACKEGATQGKTFTINYSKCTNPNFKNKNEIMVDSNGLHNGKPVEVCEWATISSSRYINALKEYYRIPDILSSTENKAERSNLLLDEISVNNVYNVNNVYGIALNNDRYNNNNSFTSKSGKIYKLYDQTQWPWSSYKYSNGETISNNGCMLTAAATVASSLWNYKITPWDFFNEKYRHALVSSSVPIMSNGKLKAKPINTNNQIIDNLQKWNPVIIMVKNNEFTSSQHYLALLDISSDGNKIFIGNSHIADAEKGKKNVKNGWYPTKDVLTNVNEATAFYCA